MSALTLKEKVLKVMLNRGTQEKMALSQIEKHFDAASKMYEKRTAGKIAEIIMCL